LLILISCLLIGVAVNFFVRYTKKSTLIGPETRELGEEDALINIVQYLDYQGFSNKKDLIYIKQLLKEYHKEIRFEIKYYPLDMYKDSWACARYAECAGRQGKFWPFHYFLLTRRNEIYQIHDPIPIFEIAAEQTGVDWNEMEICVLEDDIDELIKAHKAEADALGVKKFPAFVVNGKIIAGLEDFKLEVESLLLEL